MSDFLKLDIYIVLESLKEGGRVWVNGIFTGVIIKCFFREIRIYDLIEDIFRGKK